MPETSTRVAVRRPGPRTLTLAQVRRLGATCSVEDAAAAYGFSRTFTYELIRTGEAPFAVISVRGRRRVVTASLIRSLEAQAGAA